MNTLAACPLYVVMLQALTLDSLQFDIRYCSLIVLSNKAVYPQSSSTLWNYSKCGVYTVESEAGC
jgi:hypothetical protein